MAPDEPTAESAPVEQLAQQQALPKPVRMCNHATSLHLSETRGLIIYTTALDDTGALWERWSDWPVGRWEEIARPER